jgi:2-polyprenyl-6-methoxyphenol hydroxylase-like FAD-dependent oxidoreductase
MRAMIVGAGIGGLTAAIALRRAGIETTVFERTGEIKEVGAGILLAANAVRALGQLGLFHEVSQLGTPASAGLIHSWRGETLAAVPARELEKRSGAPSVAVHRADLQSFLLKEAGEKNVVLGAECSGFEQDDAGVTATFTDGTVERGDS